MTDKIKIKLTPRQIDILEDLNYVAMTEHSEEEWAQFLEKEVVWRKTYIAAPKLFWEQAIDDLRSEKEEAAEMAVEGMRFCEDDERCQEFTRRRLLQAYDQFIAKIEKYLQWHERKTQRPTPAPQEQGEPVREEQRGPTAPKLVPPTPRSLDENRVYIGISPTGTEWMHYRDQAWMRGKDLDTTIEFFMKHWQKWMERQPPERLQHILSNPRNEVERQFVELIEKPTVMHQGSVFRFLHR